MNAFRTVFVGVVREDLQNRRFVIEGLSRVKMALIRDSCGMENSSEKGKGTKMLQNKKWKVDRRK